jgi:hypothetical protein
MKKKSLKNVKRHGIILSLIMINHRLRVDLKKSKEDCLIPTSLYEVGKKRTIFAHKKCIKTKEELNVD